MTGLLITEDTQIWNGRNLLFCIKQKCMTGRIDSIEETDSNDKFKIKVSFIEPEYFVDVLKVGELFTIQEASRILAEGKVIGL